MKISIVGLGNAWATDDGVGPAVIRALQSKEMPVQHQFSLFTLSYAAPELLDYMQGCELLILIDAVYSGQKPGTVHCHRWQPNLLAERGIERVSMHGLGLGDMLALAQVLRQLPPCVVLWGVEAASTRPGPELSPLVAQAVPVVATKIHRQLTKNKPCPSF